MTPRDHLAWNTIQDREGRGIHHSPLPSCSRQTEVIPEPSHCLCDINSGTLPYGIPLVRKVLLFAATGLMRTNPQDPTSFLQKTPSDREARSEGRTLLARSPQGLDGVAQLWPNQFVHLLRRKSDMTVVQRLGD